MFGYPDLALLVCGEIGDDHGRGPRDRFLLVAEEVDHRWHHATNDNDSGGDSDVSGDSDGDGDDNDDTAKVIDRMIGLGLWDLTG